jgi:hypothetical protein
MDIKLAPHRDDVPEGSSTVSGDGWIGTRTLLIDSNGHRPLHCVTARLSCGDSAILVDVCCLGSRRVQTAEELLRAIAHRRVAGLLKRFFAREP